MLIDCPSCTRSYHVSRAALGETGRTVICPVCETRWFVEPPDMIAAPLAADLHDALSHHRSDGEPRGANVSSKPARRRHAASGGGALAPLLIGIACLLVAMSVLYKRTVIVAAAPRTAALYAAIGLPVNIRGLEFANVKTTRLDDVANGVEISGTIRNVSAGRAHVPKITFDIRDARGVTLSSWTDGAPKHVLASDETITFTSQTRILPEGTKDVVVHFDAAADHVASERAAQKL